MLGKLGDEKKEEKEKKNGITWSTSLAWLGFALLGLAWLGFDKIPRWSCTGIQLKVNILVFILPFQWHRGCSQHFSQSCNGKRRG